MAENIDIKDIQGQTLDEAVKITVKGSHGKVLNLIPSDDPVKNRIVETLKDRLVFHDAKSVDDVLDKTKDSYEMKVWNRLNKDLWEIAYRKNNTDIELNINPSDDNSKIKVVEHERRYYGQSDIDEPVGDFDLKEMPQVISDLRDEAKQAIHDRITNSWQKSFTSDQVEALNRYQQAAGSNTRASEMFKELLSEVAQDSEVARLPKQWISDTSDELDDLAEGITREQGQSHGLRL